jgi:hypothetical protein
VVYQDGAYGAVGDLEVDGCVRGGDSRTLDSFDGIEATFKRAAVNGTLAGIAFVSSLPDDESGAGDGEYIEVIGIGTGKTLYEVPDRPDVSPYTGVSGDGTITSLVVARNGATAWILRADTTAPVWSVYTFGGGGFQLLASGPTVAKGSLRVAGNRIYWQKGGVEQSTVLQ